MEVVGTYLGRKAKPRQALKLPMHEELVKSGMDELYYELELKLSDVLAEMEMHGIRVERSTLEEIGKDLDTKIVQIEQKFIRMAGMEFNINSPKQLGEMLFEKLGLPVMKKTKTGYSTDAEVLEKLAPYHEIVKHDPALPAAGEAAVHVRGRAAQGDSPRHGQGAYVLPADDCRDGTLSSQFPNLQNIPIRLEEGRTHPQGVRAVRAGLVYSRSGLFADRAARARAYLRR